MKHASQHPQKQGSKLPQEFAPASSYHSVVEETAIEFPSLLKKRYQSTGMLSAAKAILSEDEQEEEAFLGSQMILMLHGLL